MRELPFKVGDEIKNYKEMCKLLDEKERKANSKKSQLKRWEEYFEWENNGHKFVITNVLDSKYPTHDNNKVGINTKAYSIYLQNMLLHFLKIHSKQNNGTYKMEISARGLMSLMDLFRTEFYYLINHDENRESVAQQFDIRENFIYDFHTRVNTTSRSDIHTALKQLEQKSLIAVEEIYLGRFTTDYKYGIPASGVVPLQDALKKLGLDNLLTDFVNTFGVVSDAENPLYSIFDNSPKPHITRSLEPFEIATYLALQTYILKNLRYNNIYEVYQRGKTEHFYEKLNKELHQVLNITHVFKGYRIIFLPKTIENSDLFNSFNLDKESLESIKQQFVTEFQEGIVNNYKKRLENSTAKNKHIAIVDKNSGTSLCENNYREMTHVDRVLLGVDGLEDIVIGLLNYFMDEQKK